MAVSHVFSAAVADWTGTITNFNSQGSTTTIAATNLVRPGNWDSAHNQFYTLSGNTNNASTASGTNVVLQGLGAVTLIGSTGTIGISVAPKVTYKGYAPFDECVLLTAVMTNNSLTFVPVAVPDFQFDRIGFRYFVTNTSNSTGSKTITQRMGFYTRNASTLSLLASTSGTVTVSVSGTEGNFTNFAGDRIGTMPWTTTITRGDYWIGLLFSVLSISANFSLSQYMRSQINSAFSGIYGEGSSNSVQRLLGQGFFSTSTNALPASVAFSDITGSASVAFQHADFFFLSQTA